MGINHRLAALAAVLALGLPGGASAACKMLQIGEIPIAMRDGRPLIEATVDGQKALFLFDTGAWFSTLSAEGAKRLGLKTVREDRLTFVGVGGEVKASKAVTKEITLGNFVAKGAELFVVREFDDEEVVGVIGQLYFSRSDIEIDLAHQVVRLFQPEGCGNGLLAYWADGVGAADLDSFALADGEFITSVAVAGKKLQAKLDTGAERSVLSLDTAVALGGGLNQPTTRDAGVWSGIGAGSLQAWTMPFESFAIGPETIRNARLVVADLERYAPTTTPTGSLIGQKEDRPKMVLGADFFRSHRVYLARGQKRVYFTYNGGPVFQLTETPAKP